MRGKPWKIIVSPFLSDGRLHLFDSCHLRCCFFRYRKGDDNTGSFDSAAVNCDDAMVVFDNPVSNVEAKTSTFCFLSSCIEWFEEVFFGMVVHADAVVVDGDGQGALFWCGGDGDMMGGGGCFLSLDGVFDYVFHGDL